MDSTNGPFKQYYQREIPLRFLSGGVLWTFGSVFTGVLRRDFQGGGHGSVGLSSS